MDDNPCDLHPDSVVRPLIAVEGKYEIELLIEEGKWFAWTAVD